MRRSGAVAACLLVALVGAAATSHAGGVGPAALRLAVSTDTLPGLAATRYGVAAGVPVAVRYRVSNLGEGTFLDVRVADPGVPSGAIRCGGGGVIRRLPPGAAVTCDAVLPAAAGRWVRVVSATGTLYWYGTRVAATATTGYAGYAAGLTLTERLDGRPTDAVPAGATIAVDDVAVNTGTVPVRNVRFARGCSTPLLAPGAQATCSTRRRALRGPHTETAKATATVSLLTLRQNGTLTPAPPVTATALSAYVGLAAASCAPTHPPGTCAPCPVTPGARGAAAAGACAAGGTGAGTAGTASGPRGPRGARGGHSPSGPSGPRGARGVVAAGAAGVAASLGAARVPLPNGRAGSAASPAAAATPAPSGLAVPARTAGWLPPRLRRPSALPWLLLVFVIVVVPTVIRLVRAVRRTR